MAHQGADRATDVALSGILSGKIRNTWLLLHSESGSRVSAENSHPRRRLSNGFIANGCKTGNAYRYTAPSSAQVLYRSNIKKQEVLCLYLSKQKYVVFNLPIQQYLKRGLRCTKDHRESKFNSLPFLPGLNCAAIFSVGIRQCNTGVFSSSLIALLLQCSNSRAKLRMRL